MSDRLLPRPTAQRRVLRVLARRAATAALHACGRGGIRRATVRACGSTRSRGSRAGRGTCSRGRHAPRRRPRVHAAVRGRRRRARGRPAARRQPARHRTVRTGARSPRRRRDRARSDTVGSLVQPA